MPERKDWMKRLAEVVGERNVVADEVGMEGYSHDEFASDEFNEAPLLVVKPQSESDVARVVAFCSEHGIPITPRGGGTGLSAACVPSKNGIVLSLERLSEVIEVDEDNHTITVQAGMTLERLYQEVTEAGLFFPPHPGDESAMVGGSVAANAGGSRAVKYGTIKRFVLGLQVVTADGSIVELGGKVMKASTGYKLQDLMIGSEGTLGIITRVTFALLPPPGSIQTLVAPFETTAQAVGAVPAILKRGIVPCAVEFVEHSVIRCGERLLKKSWPTHDGDASLMFILDGVSEEEVLSLGETIAEILEEHGAMDVLLAEHKGRQAEILEVRSMLYEALHPGTVELFDVCVPRSEIADHVAFIHELEERFGVSLPTYGHAADGNVHTHSMRVRIEDGELKEELPDWRETHVKVRDELYRDAIRRKGVISGEHGIGLAKKDFLADNVGEGAVALMKSVKRALDPKGILNPGKIFEV